MRRAEASQPPFRPGVPTSGTYAEAVENRDNPLIRLNASEFSDQLHNVVWRRIAMLTGLVLQEVEFRMISALPMQSKKNLLAFLANDDFVQQRTYDAFLQLLGARRMMPKSGEIFAE